MSWQQQAIDKIKNGMSGITDRKESAMKSAVAEALKNFCQQDEAFAQAVVEGGSFAECMKAVARGVGNSISDLDAYRKAVRFYFPKADVRFVMTIETGSDTGHSAIDQPAPQSGCKILDLTDFL